MEKTTSAEAYLQKHQKRYKELETLRNILKNSELQETIKWGCPTYTINGKNVVGFAAFKEHIALWFYNGALLKDKYKVLINAQEGKTKALRQWRFTAGEEMEEDKIRQYVEEAIANQKQGKEIKPEKKELTIPPELLQKLQEDKNFHEKFNTLTPYKQREYAEYIQEAKREATRYSRLEKIIPLILEGKGLHDKYR
ncbi:YdeI/OmpD-associated family protein [Sinomicrobium weinanense]|uniref:YdeI/OmpD-associated family protein n=1 Tax=Sinomicrobium weinanense TaxID=2842200 RepID=A0A926Q2Z7_9FLAO|nr:DUF1801 domain-containing protein [Sinomicrobium weinanense]MBC9795476.1 YdeI/OmpD-associated family protein [Sinomicrobium weinanense]MBU3123377.1 YdeI/OmpD-associated family protein [Sinomicrobium weinanense]